MASAIASGVSYIHADISAPLSVSRAFSAAWPSSVSKLPLTVFHTAAVIIPSDRSPLQYAFCEAVNVRGTQHVVDCARVTTAVKEKQTKIVEKESFMSFCVGCMREC